MTSLTSQQLDDIEQRATSRRTALSGWLNCYSPVSEQVALENAEAVLEEDVPALLAEVRRLRAELEQRTEDLASAENPTRLRWGLNDVLWGDDDTVIVLMSGPDREPYWLELEADRAAVLREDLAGPPAGETHDDTDRREPCGESGCYCSGVGPEHSDCACGCDCPRCDLCRQPPEDCDCDE